MLSFLRGQPKSLEIPKQQDLIVGESDHRGKQYAYKGSIDGSLFVKGGIYTDNSDDGNRYEIKIKDGKVVATYTTKPTTSVSIGSKDIYITFPWTKLGDFHGYA